MGCSEGSDAPASRQSPLPGAGALDEAIELHLAEFDAIPPEVRRAAWTVAAIVQTLSAAAALRVLGFAHRVAGRG
jgi:hypothetical protein